MDVGTFSGKSVLLTGAAGFIGRHTVARLVSSGAQQIILLGRRSAPPELVRDPRVRWLEEPLEALCTRTWRQHGIGRIHYVFHLGAFIPKSPSEASNVENTYRDNLLGTRALLESLLDQPDRFVFASTIDVYKQPLAAVLNEESPVAPAGLYGASKLFCEKLVETYCAARGCAFSILRYGHIYGPGEESYAKLIPQTIRALLGGAAPTVYGDGTALRDLLHVTDAVEATIRSASVGARALGPINIVAGHSHEVRVVVDLLRRAAGHAGSIRYLQDRPNGPSYRFDHSKMLETLGTWDRVPLAEGLRQEFEYSRGLA